MVQQDDKIVTFKDKQAEARRAALPKPDPDADRRRVRTNIVALILAAILVGVGWLLVQKLGQSARMQDCLMSGRTNCAPIDVPRADDDILRSFVDRGPMVISGMTKLLDEALAVVRKLPPGAQDDIAGIVLRLVGKDDAAPVALTAGERAAIAVSKAAASRAEFATDAEIQAVWAKYTT